MPLPDPKTSAQLDKITKISLTSKELYGIDVSKCRDAVNVYKISRDRSTLITAATGLMIADHFGKEGFEDLRIQDFFDPANEKLKPLRKEYGQKVQAAFLNGEKEPEVLGLMLEKGYQSVIEHGSSCIMDLDKKKNFADFSLKKYLDDDHPFIHSVCHSVWDASQEMEKILKQGFKGIEGEKFPDHEKDQQLIDRSFGINAVLGDFYLKSFGIIKTLITEKGRDPNVLPVVVNELVTNGLKYYGPGALLKADSKSGNVKPIDNEEYAKLLYKEITPVQQALDDNSEAYSKTLTDILSDDKACEKFVDAILDGSFAELFMPVKDGHVSIASPAELQNGMERLSGKLTARHAQELRSKFEELGDTIDEIGRTMGDTREYRDFLTAFGKTREVISSSDDTAAVNKAVEDLKKAALPYYNAKLSSAQNERQAERFLLIDEILNIGGSEVSAEMRTCIAVAKKAILGRAQKYASSRSEAERAFAEKYKPASAELDEYARKLASSNEFQVRIEKGSLSAEDLLKKTPADVAGCVLPQLSAGRRQAFENKTEAQPLPANDRLFAKLRTLTGAGLPDMMTKFGIQAPPAADSEKVFRIPADSRALTLAAVGSALAGFYDKETKSRTRPTLDQLLDGSSFATECAEEGKAIAGKYELGGKRGFGTPAISSYLRLIECATDYLDSKLGGDITTNSFLADGMEKIFAVNSLLAEAMSYFNTMASANPELLNDADYIRNRDVDRIMASAQAVNSRLDQYRQLFEKACDLYEGKVPAGTAEKNAEIVGEMIADAAGITCSRTNHITEPAQSMSDAHGITAKIGGVREKAKSLAGARLGSGAAAKKLGRILSSGPARSELARSLVDPDVQKSLIVIDDSVCDYTVEKPAHSVLLADTAPLLDNCLDKEMTAGRLSDAEFFERVAQVCTEAEAIGPGYYGINGEGLKENLGLSVTRKTAATLAIGTLLKNGSSLEEILGGAVFEEDRLKIGKEITGRFESAVSEDGKKELAEFSAKALTEVMKQGLKYLEEKLPSPLATEDLLRPELKNVLPVVQALQDALQETVHVSGFLSEELKAEIAGLENRSKAVCEMIGNHGRVLHSVNAFKTGKKKNGDDLQPDDFADEIGKTLLPAAGKIAYIRSREFTDPGCRFDRAVQVDEIKAVDGGLAFAFDGLEENEEVKALAENGGKGLDRFLRSVVNSNAMDNFFAVGKNGVSAEKDVRSIPELPSAGKYTAERRTAKKSMEDSLLRLKLDDRDILAQREIETDPQKRKELTEQLPTDEEVNKQTDPAKKAEMRNKQIASVLKEFTVKSGTEALFTGDAAKAIDTMLDRLEQGREVYMIQKETTTRPEKYFRFTKNDDGLVTNTKKVHMIRNDKDRRAVLKDLNGIKALLEGTGVTRGDSDAFKDMKKAVNEAIEGVNNGTRALHETVFSDIRRSAERYYFEKLDQPHNSRRSARFEIADQLRNIGVKSRYSSKVSVTDTERLKFSIAARVVKTGATELLGSGNVEFRARGINILQGGEIFRSNVEKLMNSDSFRKLVDGKTKEQLRKELAKDPGDLKTAILGKQPKESRILEQPELTGPSLNNI